MASAKAIQIGKDLDLARCNGNWLAIQDLARRYKKYHSEGAILEQTVLAEANLIQIVSNARSSNTICYTADVPSRISMEDRLDAAQVQNIQEQLRAVIQISDGNGTSDVQKEFAKIILARTHFECGEYQEVIDIIGQLSFEKEQVSHGYSLVLFLQARVIKAISFELLGNEDAALQSYEGVESILSENPTVKNKSFIEWSEEALYRATLLGLKDGSPISTKSLLEFMRQYQKMTTVQPASWRTHKRMTITRHSLRYVSTVYRQGNYHLPANSLPPGESESDPELERQTFIVEQSQLHTIYEKMLYLEVPLPRAGEVNTRVLDFVNQFANDFELIGTTAHDLRGFVEALDRASQRTFNSPLITRHLFRALVRLGEYDEAEHALHSYLYLVGLVSHGWKETHRDGQALATDKSGLNMAIPILRPEVEDNDECDSDVPNGEVNREVGDIADIKNSEKESALDTLEVLIIAIKMYCNDISRGVDAVEMAEMAKELYQKQNKRERTATLLEVGAQVYRSAGVAYGYLGSQTFDPELRPKYHEKALHFLERSLKLDPNPWETYYQLALQQAEMHDIGQAVQSITKAIQSNSSNLPLWHLLTLIISCPVHGDYKQALKTCEIGLQQAAAAGYGDIVDDYTGSGYDEAEQHLMFQLTRTLLLNILHGPESALESSETLFTSYGKIAIPDASLSTNSQDRLSYGGAHHGMIISGSLGNLSELQIAAENRRRGRSASNSMVHQYPQASSSADLATHLGSRSHDNVNTAPTQNTLTVNRARSASNLAAPSPLGPGGSQQQHSTLLAVPDESSKPPLPNQQQQHHHHYHIHGLHLFGSRSTSSKHKAIESSSGGNLSIQSLPATSPYDLKSITNNSVASLQSMSPSITSIQSILQPSSIPNKPSTRTMQRKQKSDRILSDLWLLTAHMFIKLGKLDEARKAVEEAENVDWVSNPQVWCVLGQLLQVEGDFEQAQNAFYKSLVMNPNDVNCRLWLAKSHLTQDSQEIAEGILEIMTKSNGWDCAEAWFHLGEIYRKTDRLDRTKACLFYALELESTTPIQPFSVLPRYI